MAVDEKLMTQALAVKRGEQRLADLPDAQREKVRGVLRSTSDSKLRQFAAEQAGPSKTRVAQRSPQRHIRRARTA